MSREPSTAQLEVASSATTLRIWDHNGRYSTVNVLPSVSYLYDGRRPEIEDFQADADRMLTENGTPRTSNWVRTDGGDDTCGDWATTIAIVADETTLPRDVCIEYCGDTEPIRLPFQIRVF